MIDTPIALPALARVEAIGLTDGSLLVVGQRRISDLAEAWRTDLGADLITELNASRAASTLHALSDGTVVELDETGLSLRRDRVLTPFDNPPATLLVDDPELSIDIAAHWTRVSDRLVAQVDDARLDVAGLVFGSFSLTLDVEVALGGHPTLRLEGAGSRTNIVIAANAVSIRNCEVARSNSSEALTIERHGNQLTLRSGDKITHCSADLPEHVSLAIAASFHCAIGPIKLQRL